MTRKGRKRLNFVCSFSGCERQAKAKTLCDMHWKRDWVRKFPHKERELQERRKKRHMDLYGRPRQRKRRTPQEERSQLLSRYGLTLASYEHKLRLQKGRCGICESTSSHTKLTKKLFVDHCHETGYNRGLLCQKCNMALGGFNYNIQLLDKAIDYLERWKYAFSKNTA